MSHSVLQSTCCPYCGEQVSVLIRPSTGDREYIEDCETCCRLMVIHSLVSDRGISVIIACGENE
ncbi:MAG: CPXCG motif-containing cysteine-rich protein [Halioglobus sp.]